VEEGLRERHCDKEMEAYLFEVWENL